MPKPIEPTAASRVFAAVRLIPVLLAVVALGLLTGCWNRSPEPEPAAPLGGVLYQLQEGSFTPVVTDQGTEAIEFQPWTVQGRVSDLVSVEDRVYLGINGYGIAELTIGETAVGETRDLVFRYFYDAMIFRYRTLTTLIPEQDSLLCHLYFNKLLNVVSETELKLQGISLLRLFPRTGVYEFITAPYQEAHPDWEAVGFVPLTTQEFFFQWKYSDRNRTLFSYSRFDLVDLEEQEAGELGFRRSYGFHSLEERGSGPLKLLLAEAQKLLDEPEASTGYQLYIRTDGQSLIRRYEYHPDDFTSADEIRLVTLSGVRRAEHALLLLPGGLLLKASPGSRQIQRFRLADLPEGYAYRDLLLHGQYLLASWEQPSFTEVGAAGIFLEKFPFFP